MLGSNVEQVDFRRNEGSTKKGNPLLTLQRFETLNKSSHRKAFYGQQNL